MESLDPVAVEHAAAMRGLPSAAAVASALLSAACGGASTGSAIPTWPVYLLGEVGTVTEAKAAAVRLSTPIMIHANSAYALSPQCLPERQIASLEDVRAFAALEDGRQYGSDQDERTIGSSQDDRDFGGGQDERTIGSSQDDREFGGNEDERTIGSSQDSRAFGGNEDWRRYGSIADYRDFGARVSRMRCSLDKSGTTPRLHGGQNSPAFLYEPIGPALLRVTHAG